MLNHELLKMPFQITYLWGVMSHVHWAVGEARLGWFAVFVVVFFSVLIGTRVLYGRRPSHGVLCCCVVRVWSGPGQSLLGCVFSIFFGGFLLFRVRLLIYLSLEPKLEPSWSWPQPAHRNWRTYFFFGQGHGLQLESGLAIFVGFFLSGLAVVYAAEWC